MKTTTNRGKYRLRWKTWRHMASIRLRKAWLIDIVGMLASIRPSRYQQRESSHHCSQGRWICHQVLQLKGNRRRRCSLRLQKPTWSFHTTTMLMVPSSTSCGNSSMTKTTPSSWARTASSLGHSTTAYTPTTPTRTITTTVRAFTSNPTFNSTMTPSYTVNLIPVQLINAKNHSTFLP